MNILLVNSAAPDLWGGGEKWFVEAAQWFKERGHQVNLLATANSRLMKRAQECGIETGTFHLGGDFDPRGVLRARRILMDTRADVVLTNFNKESWHYGVAGKLLRVPIVARHGFTLWSDKFHHRFLAQRVVSGVIANAENILEHYRSIGIQPRRSTVIHNGVRNAPLQPGVLREALGIGADTLLLVAAGRLEEQKRFDKLLKFAAELTKMQSFMLAIFGKGPHEELLRHEAQRLGLESKVRWLGFDSEFAAKVCDADLFLLTSDSEGTPNVVLEALAAGVPVVGFNVGNMRDILHGELQELLVDANDDKLFERKLISLTSNRERLKQLREASRMRVEHEFNFDHSMQRYEEFLQTVTSGRD